MANWQRTIRLQPQWGRAKDGKLSASELAASIATKLRGVASFGSHLDDERDEIAEEFEALAADKSADVNDFDRVMDHLYDWGDTRLDDKWPGKKACWIDTFSTVST